jgi:serine/threonine-protein kinase HipA
MSNPRCKICLEPLESRDYHPACCRRLFGGAQAPRLPFTWTDLNSLAEKVVRSHVAVPGVQPKLSLHLERGGARDGGRFTIVGLEGDYILKAPVERFPEMPELEHLTMRMARCFGIETAECGLAALDDGKLVLIVRRMDRAAGAKLHMEDMCQLTDRLTEEKYRGSLEAVGKAILRHCDNPGLDVLRLFEVNLFCFLTGNSDMHLKNFSLIRSVEGEIRFTPSYDLLPVALLLPEDTEDTALTLHGKKKKLRAGDFRAFGQALTLSERQVANVIVRFEKGLSTANALIDCGFCSQDMKDRYHKLLANRWQRLFASHKGNIDSVAPRSHN